MKNNEFSFKPPFTPNSELATKYAGEGDPFNPKLKQSRFEKPQEAQGEAPIDNSPAALMAAFFQKIAE